MSDFSERLGKSWRDIEDIEDNGVAPMWSAFVALFIMVASYLLIKFI